MRRLNVSEACRNSPSCFHIVSQALQATLFYHAKVTDLGEAMAKALETTMRGALKHSIVFGENRMILERSKEEVWL